MTMPMLFWSVPLHKRLEQLYRKDAILLATRWLPCRRLATLTLFTADLHGKYSGQLHDSKLLVDGRGMSAEILSLFLC